MVSAKKLIIKRHYLNQGICLYIFIVTLFMFTPVAVCIDKTPDKPLKIVCDDRFPPFEFREGDKMSGLAVDLVKTLLTRMQIPYSIESYPWKRAESMVLSGEADALFSASYLDARADACWYPLEHLFESVYVLFIRIQDEDVLHYDGFEDLKPKHIGVTLGYSYNELFWMFLKGTGNYSEATTDEQNLQMLANGRCDFSIIEKNVGKTLIKTMHLEDKITYIPKTLIQKPYFLIFNKKQVPRSLADRFSKELNIFKTTEEYKKTYSIYFKE